MRSLKIATGTVLASTALLFSVPTVAYAAPSGCEEAQSQATEAEADYEAAKKQFEGGDTSLKQQVQEAEQNANQLASEAQRICGDQVMDPSAKPSDPAKESHPAKPDDPGKPSHPAKESPTAPSTEKPSGAMHTGAGPTDPGAVPGLAVAGGLAVVAAAGIAVRRRTGGAQR